jgi:hypothetical protein
MASLTEYPLEFISRGGIKISIHDAADMSDPLIQTRKILIEFELPVRLITYYSEPRDGLMHQLLSVVEDFLSSTPKA